MAGMWAWNVEIRGGEMYVNVEFYDTSFRLVKPNRLQVPMQSLDTNAGTNQTKSVPLRTCRACLPRSLTKPLYAHLKYQ